MNCHEIADRLIESARRELDPGRVVRAHLQSCATCRDRQESEENLSAHVKAIRLAVWDQRSSSAAREVLMRRFAAQHRPVLAPAWAAPGWGAPGWYWALAAAAVLLLSIVAVPGFERGLQERLTARNAAAVSDSASESADLSADLPVDPEAEGFIAVPYVPPLAPGEMLRVEHRELNPAALASLGVSVDPAWNTQLPADVLLGEDGMPRAVRVSDTSTDGSAPADGGSF
jgi:hypothetical protein